MDIVRETIVNGGITVDLNGNVPISGYAVSDGMHERIVSVDSLEFELSRYVKEYRAELSQPNAYLGTWLDNGNVYLDISQVIQYREDAIVLGRQLSEQAIYDIGNNTEVRL